MITELSDTGRRLSINILPDDVLLEIFDHYVILPHGYHRRVNAWHKLVHVCQRWRYVVFDSTRRLHLRLRCTDKTPVTKMLDIWPALPIVISARPPLLASGVTNIISALQQHNRVCTIEISGVPNPLLKEVAAMQDPFPALPKLLLSTHDLVTLDLSGIPRSGYFSPEAMVTALSTLTSLKSLFLRFRSPRSQVDRASRHPPPLTRVVLPALTSLWFKGDSEYLEDIVSRLDAPLLNFIEIRF